MKQKFTPNKIGDQLWVYDLPMYKIVITIGKKPEKASIQSPMSKPNITRQSNQIVNHNQRFQSNLVKIEQQMQQQSEEYVVQNEYKELKYFKKTVQIQNQIKNDYSSQFLIDQSSFLEMLIYKIHQKKVIDKLKKHIVQNGNEFQIILFELLIKRIKNLTKTKEEKLKYLVRKTLRQNREGSNQFNLKCKEHNKNNPLLQILELKNINTIPQKNLYKALKVPIFRTSFQQTINNTIEEFEEQNKKKIEQLSQVIKECIRFRNQNILNSRSKMPWTRQIFEDIIQFGKELLKFTQ